jgi:hypothetical protein
MNVLHGFSFIEHNCHVYHGTDHSNLKTEVIDEHSAILLILTRKHYFYLT